MSTKKEIKRLLDKATQQGATVRLTKSCHHQVRNSDGVIVATCPSTTRNPTSIRNTRAALRRAGYEV